MNVAPILRTAQKSVAQAAKNPEVRKKIWKIGVDTFVLSSLTKAAGCLGRGVFNHLDKDGWAQEGKVWTVSLGTGLVAQTLHEFAVPKVLKRASQGLASALTKHNYTTKAAFAFGGALTAEYIGRVLLTEPEKRPMNARMAAQASFVQPERDDDEDDLDELNERTTQYVATLSESFQSRQLPQPSFSQTPPAFPFITNNVKIGANAQPNPFAGFNPPHAATFGSGSR